jgi:hypothetical protein
MGDGVLEDDYDELLLLDVTGDNLGVSVLLHWWGNSVP